MSSAHPAQRVLLLNWRDRSHPEGGGSEQYVEEVAAWLARVGRSVTLFCADHGNAPAAEVTQDGVRILRRGGRRSVYLHGLLHLLRSPKTYDVVLDVQNGLPFWSRLVTRRPVVVLVHHVHKEQWPVVFPPRQAAVGWWLESAVAPRLYRGSSYVVVSEITRDELVALGVRRSDVTVVHNGVEAVKASATPRSTTPRLCVVNRLVPHKRVEIAFAAVASLAASQPDLQLSVVGDGYWLPELVAEVERLGISDRIMFLGHVDDQTKHQVMAESWAILVPSLKEGWGLTVVEAALHATPAVAFHGSGGLDESIVDEVTGLLVPPTGRAQEQFTAATERLLLDAALRQRLGAAARERAQGFDWPSTGRKVAQVLDAAVARSGRGGSHGPPPTRADQNA